MARIVHIRHEMGDLSEWTSTTTDSGNLSVEVAAALAGTGFGLQFVIDDTNTLQAQKTFTELGASPTDLRLRFYIDPNSLTMATNDEFLVLQILDFGLATILNVSLNYNASTYRLAVHLKADGSSTARS